MAKLKKAEIQQCLNLVEEYMNALPDSMDSETTKKRDRARLSLDHLSTLSGAANKEIASGSCNKDVPNILDAIIVGCN